MKWFLLALVLILGSVAVVAALLTQSSKVLTPASDGTFVPPVPEWVRFAINWLTRPVG